MSRYTGARFRIGRRLGPLPGFTTKKTPFLSKPGQHGYNRTRGRRSEYATRLEEKQKLRFNYGLSEKQLINYVRKAKKHKGVTGTIPLQLLEMRLDNTIFRLGMAPTIVAARQLVTHRHILINNNCVSIPSYQCQPGDVVSIKNKTASIQLVKSFLRLNKKRSGFISKLPPHLNRNKKKLSGKIVNMINRKSVPLKLNELFVIEYYSRKI